MEINHRDQAIQVLDHYITLLMKKQGLKVDSDTHAEVAEVIDNVIEASVEVTIRRLASAHLPGGW